MDYNQHENIQTRKTISSYGGVGSILETRNGSLIISPFNQWPYFMALNGNFKDEHLILDKRFKNRLRKYFSNLNHLIRVPINEIEGGKFSSCSANLLSGKYFPEWFYCNECHKFDKHANWKKNWEIKVKQEDKSKFFPPKCYKCYLDAQLRGKRKLIDLEQIRFILISPGGEVADIPWERWAFSRSVQKDKRENYNNGTDTNAAEIRLANIDIPKDLEMELIPLNKYSDLSGLAIFSTYDAGRKKAFATLSGLFSLRIPKKELFPGNNEEVVFKPVLRSSNSVYYPNILSSIFLPADDELNEATIEKIKKKAARNKTASEISEDLLDDNVEISEAEIQSLIDNDFDLGLMVQTMSENEYRLAEYKFITTHHNSDLKDDLIFQKVSKGFYPHKFLKSVTRMDKIRITSVQTSYTRQEPIDRDYYLRPDSDIQNTKEKISKKYTSEGSGFGQLTNYLPAMENFGEGIFFEFEEKTINNWVVANKTVVDRVMVIVNNHRSSEGSLNKDLNVTPALILIHTFSHLIIKELEFLCGYPSTSLQERLYIDEGKMSGALIYTISGAEGSYGGLTSLCKSSKLDNIIQSAVIRAKDCASDPICYHSSGQGVGNLNLSACYSCTLLPETSCEQFNCYLDRRLLIDDGYGFFKDLYKSEQTQAEGK
ncbi:DUF1998 domain-containing protein [Segetibacter koreensis]|uniref:DUF1998 domain-containing protein n=1 Tax=Segetibacter koreensis TaxID=398037 RepID=UPI00035DF0EF|nr:DUF1998 domain-containing protein [Segetibacter koreensis]